MRMDSPESPAQSKENIEVQEWWDSEQYYSNMMAPSQ